MSTASPIFLIALLANHTPHPHVLCVSFACFSFMWINKEAVNSLIKNKIWKETQPHSIRNRPLNSQPSLSNSYIKLLHCSVNYKALCVSTMLYLLGVIDCSYLEYIGDLLLSLHIQVGKPTSVTTPLIYPAWYKTTDISHQTSTWN